MAPWSDFLFDMEYSKINKSIFVYTADMKVDEITEEDIKEEVCSFVSKGNAAYLSPSPYRNDCRLVIIA
jgi:hypothetical protein